MFKEMARIDYRNNMTSNATSFENENQTPEAHKVKTWPTSVYQLKMFNHMHQKPKTFHRSNRDPKQEF